MVFTDWLATPIVKGVASLDTELSCLRQACKPNGGCDRLAKFDWAGNMPDGNPRTTGEGVVPQDRPDYETRHDCVKEGFSSFQVK